MTARPVIALLGVALLTAAPALAQQAALSPATPPTPSAAGPRGPGAMFERLDADRDGRVTWEEGWGWVQTRFNEADRDRDGGLTQDEIRAAMPGRAGGDSPREGRRAERGAALFRALDADRDGRVTLTELRPAAEARMRALDVNGDNAVSREELPRGGRHRGGDAPSR